MASDEFSPDHPARDQPEQRAAAPPHHHFQEIGSTNDEAMRLLDRGAVHGTAVTADFQTAGRGQPGRRWWMPPGEGILLSVILRRPPPGIAFGDLTLWLGGTLAKWLAARTGLKIDVKPPNDLLCGGRKVGGILCEARWRDDHLEGVIVGVGLTVNVQSFPPELEGIAGSLALAAGRAFSVPELREELIELIRKKNG